MAKSIVFATASSNAFFENGWCLFVSITTAGIPFLWITYLLRFILSSLSIFIPVLLFYQTIFYLQAQIG